MASLMQRIMGLAARARVITANDSGKIQTVQIEALAGEIRQVERLQQYGFTSVPRTNTGPAILIAPTGDRSQAVLIVADDRDSRPAGQAVGTVTVYDSLGQTITLSAAGITIDTPLGVTVNAGTDVDVNATGDVNVIAGGAANVQAATALIDAPSVDLGGLGGPAVARIGDLVNVVGGSSAGTHAIISGSSKVRAS